MISLTSFSIAQTVHGLLLTNKYTANLTIKTFPAGKWDTRSTTQPSFPMLTISGGVMGLFNPAVAGSTDWLRIDAQSNEDEDDQIRKLACLARDAVQGQTMIVDGWPVKVGDRVVTEFGWYDYLPSGKPTWGHAMIWDVLVVG